MSGLLPEWSATIMIGSGRRKWAAQSIDLLQYVGDAGVLACR